MYTCANIFNDFKTKSRILIAKEKMTDDQQLSNKTGVLCALLLALVSTQSC